MNNIHKNIEEWMATSLAGGLSAQEKAAFEKHLAFCEECQKTWKEEQMLSRLLNSTLSEQRPEGNFEDRIVRGFRIATRAAPKPVFGGILGFLGLHWIETGVALAIVVLMIGMGRSAVRRARESAIYVEGNFGREMVAVSKVAPPPSSPQPAAPPPEEKTREKGNLMGDTDKESLKKDPIGQRIAQLEDQLQETGAAGAAQQSGSGIKASGYVDTSYLVNLADWKKTARPSNASSPAPAAQILLAEASHKPDRPASAENENKREGESSNATPAPLVDTRKLIRNATMEFEVQSYDASLEKIMKLAAEEKGYVATTNSSRLPNGKVRGQVIVKVLPENLEVLILKLRALGDLKNQAIATQDVTKAYFDTEARVRNGKLMEERLLKLLEDPKGKVTDLLVVEKELARVRENIEQLQSEIKVYDALIQYATITITLAEKDLNEAAGFLLKEQANLSVFSFDVEKTFRDARKEAEDLKAQILRSNLERQANGPVSATLSVIVAPEQSDTLLQQFRALGRPSNVTLISQRVAQGGTDPNLTALVKRDWVEINLDIQPDDDPTAQHTTLAVFVNKVEEMAEKAKKIAQTSGADIRSANFQHAADGQEQANFVFRIPAKQHKTFIEQLQELGKVREYSHNRQEHPDGGAKAENAPVEVSLSLFNRGDLVPQDYGFFSTLRKTFSEGTQALLGSIQSIIVGIAYILPWILGFGLVTWLVYVLKNRIRKS